MELYPNLKNLIGYRLFTATNPVAIYRAGQKIPFKTIPKKTVIGVLKRYVVNPKTKITWLVFKDSTGKEYSFPWIKNKSDFDWTKLPKKKSVMDNILDVFMLPFTPTGTTAALEATKEGEKQLPTEATNVVKSVVSNTFGKLVPYAIGTILLVTITKSLINGRS
jgi:hypothetical protein